MSLDGFDGTLVLEGLVAIGKLEEYADAVDADDIQAATRLLEFAGFDSEIIDLIVEQMTDA